MTCLLFRGATRRGLVLAFVWLAALWPVAAAAQDNQDPFEGFNRKVFAFNDRVDAWVLRPVAVGYDRITPQPVQRRVGNFYENLTTPFSAVNQVLQGKPRAGLSDLTRFIVNTTVGIGGLFDVAGANGLPRRNEDFGQTFAVWSGGQGPYIVLPFRGPATTTHAAGMVVGAITSPLRLISPMRDRIIVGAIEVVDTRADLLSSERMISGDRYLFIRDAYLQNRQYEINDGEVTDDPFLDDDF